MTYSIHLGGGYAFIIMYFMFRVLIVHCSGLSSGRERVRRARVIIALSLATCQYNLEAMRKARREGGEKREKGNVEKSREKGIKQRKEGKERYTYEREMDEEGGKWRKKEEMGKREEGKGKGGRINANTTKESRNCITYDRQV